MPDTPSQAAYRAFCPTAPDLPVFAQAWYLDACAEGGTWDAVLVTEAGRVVAALPFFYKQRGPFCYVTMPLFVKWLGPYLLPELRGKLAKEHHVLKALLDQLPEFAAFRQNFYPSITNWLPFYWQQFQQTTHYTYRLTGLDDLAAREAAIDADTRRDLRRARQQVQVVHDQPADELFRLLQLSFDRQKLPLPCSPEQFWRHEAALAQQQARQLFFAVDAEGRVHSAAMLIWDRQAAYFHLAGDDPALRRSGAGKLVIWEAIRYTSEVLGLPCFDFEGSMLPGIEFVRVRFGAVQVPYFVVWQHRSRAFRLLEQLRHGLPF